MTHEEYIQSVRDAVRQLAGPDHQERLSRVKLAYGYGTPGLRGVTMYSRWANGHGPEDPDPFVEICAAGEESTVQLAGTTIHELGHVIAGWDAGHGKDWKDACKRLGLRCVRAAGTQYSWSMFSPELRAAIVALGEPTDGRPTSQLNGAALLRIGRRKSKQAGTCTAGLGTRGGKSRGPGSGSRMRKYVCDHGQIIRAATDDLDATCNVCQSPFMQPN